MRPASVRHAAILAALAQASLAGPAAYEAPRTFQASESLAASQITGGITA